MFYHIIIILKPECKNKNSSFLFSSIDFVFSSTTNEISTPIGIRKSFLRPKSPHIKHEI